MMMLMLDDMYKEIEREIERDRDQELCGCIADDVEAVDGDVGGSMDSVIGIDDDVVAIDEEAAVLELSSTRC